MEFDIIENGSVTSPAGFLAAGVVAGLKRSGAADMALLASDRPARVAGAFTANRFCSPAVTYDREVVAARQPVRAVIVNSGNANACTGAQGLADARATATRVAELLKVRPDEVLVSSTGRIGVPLPMAKILAGAEKAVAALAADGGPAAARAIMTTDTRPKCLAVEADLGRGRRVRVGGMTKGAGMIGPHLLPVKPALHATMLAYLTTDAPVEQDLLEACLAQSLDRSFNRITVDGDMSTNDTCLLFASGAAGGEPLRRGTRAGRTLAEAVAFVAGRLAREMVMDGEGVTRFVELTVRGARTRAEARRCAEAIANSALCKTAWFGADPNWGRVLCAAGRAGVALDPDRVNLDYEGVPIVRGGVDAGVPEAEQSKAINRREFRIDLDLGVGRAEFALWTCDLTYEYVKINADYHT